MFWLFWNSLWFIHRANSVLLLPCCPLRGRTNLTPHYTSLKFIQMAQGSSGTTGPNWTCCAKGAMQGAKITERKQLDQKLIYKWGRTQDGHPTWVIWSSGQFWVSQWKSGISMHLMVDFTSPKVNPHKLRTNHVFNTKKGITLTLTKFTRRSIWICHRQRFITFSSSTPEVPRMRKKDYIGYCVFIMVGMFTVNKIQSSFIDLEKIIKSVDTVRSNRCEIGR